MSGSLPDDTGLGRAGWAIVLVALLLRLAVALSDQSLPAKDAADYDALAWRLASGEGYTDAEGSPTAFRPPGLPMLLAGAYAVAGHSLPAARLVQAGVGTLCVLAVLLLAGRLGGGARARLLAGSLAAVYPAFVWSYFGTRSLLTEPLFTALFSLALAVLVDTGRPRAWIAGGALLGLATLTRGTALVVAIALTVFGLAARSRRPRFWVGCLGMCLLVMLPWLVRNRVVMGGWVPVSTNGGISLWTSYNPRSRGLGNAAFGYEEAKAKDAAWRVAGYSEIERSGLFLREALGIIEADRTRAGKLVMRKALLFVDPTLTPLEGGERSLNYGYVWLLPFAGLGLITSLKGRQAGSSLLVLVAIGAYSFMHIAVHTAARYRVPVEPALIVWAGIGLEVLSRRLGARGSIAVAAVWTALVALAAWRYDSVFSALSGLVRWLGLG